MATILVVDDETNIVNLVSLYLKADGYQVVAASGGRQALDAFHAHAPDLIVLDLMLPGIDGWEVCQRIRQESQVPVIMLTARTDDVDKIVGLELGADDYLVKPFNPRELLARIKAVLRRTEQSISLKSAAKTMKIGEINIDVERREVRVQGKLVALRAKEFDLLLAFATNLGFVLSREQLLTNVWGYEFYGDTRTVDVHVAHLREKLKQADVNIETVWGIGYKLVSPDRP
ncbi:MAG: response regulator transcription factor [Chloroflexi bacterium]|nr:response regulator transcription factor [Chloroflexota bacterium]